MYKKYISKRGVPKGYLRQTLLIMRLTTIILVIATMHVSAFSFAQRISLSEKDATLSQVFDHISNQCNYNFIFTSDLLKGTKPVTISVKNTDLEKVLELIFEEQPITFVIEGKTVVVKMKQRNIPATNERRQLIDIKGKVVDDTDKPLVGATIKIKGTDRSTSTNEQGEFSLSGVSEDAAIEISFVGFFTVEKPVSADLSIIKLRPNVGNLGEVAVVSTGYQKLKPEQITGSISSIGVKQYDSRINTTNFLTGLQNKIPGLLINNDIKFEGNSLFQIRGISTISGNKNPLIVIDGFPTELTLDMINPNEIESVTVLKDAAAATIYGVRASNGVIVIDLKKARAGRPVVSFRGTTSFTPKENYGRYRWDKNGSNISIDYDRANNTYDPIIWTLNNLFSTIPVANLSPANFIKLKRDAGIITTDAEANQQYQALGSYNNAKDYGRYFTRTAATQTYNVNISGGNENALYYITANYANNDATQVKRDNDQFLLSARMSLKFSSRLSLDMTTDLQQGRSSSVPVPNIENIYPYERFKDDAGNPLSIFSGSNVTPYRNGVLMGRGLLDNLYYPISEMDNVIDKSKIVSNRIRGTFLYKISNGLSASIGGIYEKSALNNRHFASENSAEVRQYVNRYTKISNGIQTNYIPKGSFLKEETNEIESYTLRAQLNFNRYITKDHQINVILGSELRDVQTTLRRASYFGYDDQTLVDRPVDYNYINTTFRSSSSSYVGTNPSLIYNNLFGHTYTDDRFVSLYSNAVYTYKSKYSLSGSLRIDQSNLFGTDPKYQYKPLGSVGAAWNLEKEKFLEDVNWITSLKLRVAYGRNGNVAKKSLPQIIASNTVSRIDPNIPTLTLLSPANKGLRWEQTKNFNAGVDYHIFKNITGSVDYYSRNSVDILATNRVDETRGGGTSALINQASIRNTGLEINLQSDWITRKRFNWNTGLVFSYNTSKVLEVYNNFITTSSPSTSYVAASNSNYLKGYPVGALFSYRYAGVNNVGAPLIYGADGTAHEFFVTDQGISELDYAGSSIPTYNAGLSNRFDIGNFYFYCMINYYGGFKTRRLVPTPSAIRPLEGANNYWRQAGDEKDPNMLPAINQRSSDALIGLSDKYTVNGSYFTLGDLTVSYNFRNSSWLKYVKLSNLEVRAQASNVYTIGLNKYNYSLATGSYAKSYLTPTYTFAINANF